MAVVSSDHATLLFGAVIIFSGLVTVGIISQLTWRIIMDDLKVCQSRFDNPTPGPVYELLAIYCSISPTLDSFLVVYRNILSCVIFVR